MGSTTGIQWAHATWNPVRGCTKISEGCAHCYAADFSLRNPATLGSWEPSAPRVIGGPANWREPVKLAKAHIKALAEHAAGRPISEVVKLRERADRAKDPRTQAQLHTEADRIERRTVEGRPLRIFTASLGDIGEDHPQVEAVRDRIWRETLPELDALRLPDGRPAAVLLALTKRARVMRDWYDAHGCPDTVWPGVTVENQRRADERLPIMAGLPRLWLSMEPLLGPVQLADAHLAALNWIIVGGESGPNARAMHPEWVRHLRDQAVAAGVPFHFKQHGEWVPKSHTTRRHPWHAEQTPDDGDWRVPAPFTAMSCALGIDGSCFMNTTVWNGHDDDGNGEAYMLKLGKHAAGRILDGRTWDEVPDYAVAP